MSFKINKLTKAMALAAKWHEYQVDKSNVPYVAHLMGVWNRVRNESEDVQCVALLHDIFEDTQCLPHEVHKLGQDIYDAVVCLTHTKRETYASYIQRVKQNPTARIVKLADLADNTSEYRLQHLNEGDKEYLGNKRVLHYEPAIKELQT